jgi:hypothetical protein
MIDDDLFGPPQPAVPDEEEEEGAAPAPAALSSTYGSMLGDGDDDLQFSTQPAAAPAPSALLQWQRGKAAELEGKDGDDHAAEGALRAAAAASLDRFYADVKEASANRARHNAELDAQRADALAGGDNPWAAVGELSAFARTDLHVRDVAGMKKLLISLKTKPPTKG